MHSLSICDWMVEKKDYTKHIMKERVNKTFSTDMQTLGMIKDFMEKYHRHNLSKAIDDLVNIGLANLGYRTEKEIEERFKGIDVSPEKITIPKPESFDINLMATTIFPFQHKRMQLLLEIIQRLCNESVDKSASREDVINEAEIRGIESCKIEEALDRLCQDGKIYETPQGKYGVK